MLEGGVRYSAQDDKAFQQASLVDDSIIGWRYSHGNSVDGPS
jgi:hypothetical protein